MYGCGCWAENEDAGKPAVATSSSGVGEFLIRTCLARETASQLRNSSCVVESLHHTIKEKFLGNGIYGCAVTV